MPFNAGLSNSVVLRRRSLVAFGGILAAAAAIPQRTWADQPVPLRIGGTGMALAAMRQIGEAFAEVTPGVEVKVLPSLGTGGGLAAVAAGAIELALAARDVNDAERAKRLHSLPYARTPIAFVTHPETGVRAVTLQQVAEILAGQMRVWPGGTPIRLVRREPSDADWTMLRGMSAVMAAAVTTALERPGLLTVATDQENADALERLPGSFGAMSIGQLRAEARRVIPLSLDGASPTVEALAAGRYPLSRILRVAWREPPDPNVIRFRSFLSGSQAADILERLGHSPVNGQGE